MPLPSVVRKQEVDSKLLVLWQRRANCQQPRALLRRRCSTFDLCFIAFPATAVATCAAAACAAATCAAFVAKVSIGARSCRFIGL